MDSDRRRHERQSTSIRVEMHHSAFGTIKGYTEDISDGGAAVQLDGAVTPPVGTVVMVSFKKISGAINDKPVAMVVMHQERNRLGLMFSPS